MRSPAIALLLASLVLAGCSDAKNATPEPEADFEDFGLEASDTTGILRGVVIDEAIRPIAGVQIVLIGPDTNRTMLTREDGLFGFDGLAPGDYFVSASKLGFTAIQSSGRVQAGVKEPSPIKIQLTADPSTRPYVQLYHLDAFMTCSARPMFIGIQCGFGQSNNVVNSEEELTGRPLWIQSEMTWQSTQAIGDELSLAIRCHPGDNDPAGKCPDGVAGIVRSEGTSPQVAIINQTLADFWALGGEGGNPLIINLFAFGRSDLDVWDEKTIDDAQKPATGNDCMQWGLVGQVAFGFDPASCMRLTGPGFVYNQKIDVYTNVFYGFAPVEGWMFLTDGEHPVP